MTLEAIKEAIISLPREERHALAFWLNELENDEWDKQMREDFSPGGRLMPLVEKITREFAERKALSPEKRNRRSPCPSV